MTANQEAIKDRGLDGFVAAQSERLAFLDEMLTGFDNGRSKSFYCLAAALLTVDGLRQAIDSVAPGGDVKTRATQLRTELEAAATREQIELRLKR